MENKISVVINTYNAEKHLRKVLESVKGFDEVLICDMESTDSTLEIAQEYNCRIITFPREEYNIVEPAREFAIHQAQNKWVLVVDADELVTDILRQYLYDIIQKPDCPEGIHIPRKNFFMHRFMHASFPDYQLRFFNQEKTFWPSIIHTQPKVDGPTGRIPKWQGAEFVHIADDSITERMKKINLYTGNEIEKRKNRHFGVAALLFRPLFFFFKSYILKKGFLDGVPGFIYACMDGYYQLVMLAKILESKKSVNP